MQPRLTLGAHCLVRRRAPAHAATGYRARMHLARELTMRCTRARLALHHRGGDPCALARRLLVGALGPGRADLALALPAGGGGRATPALRALDSAIALA